MNELSLDNIVLSSSSQDAKYALVYTNWNSKLTEIMLSEAKKELLNNSVKEVNITTLRVPGAFELPLGAKSVSRKDDVDAIICLGVVIKGDTPHFEFICNSCSQAIINLSLELLRPVIFGVLTTNNLDEAEERIDPSKMNKGKEFAKTAMQMLENL